MKVFLHHIYEYKKGIRNLVLHTLDAKLRAEAETKLQHQNIDYQIQEVTEHKINIFFGNKESVEVVRSFGSKKLNHFSAEEDFMLGIMLGYDRVKQCSRYLNMLKIKTKQLDISTINPN